MRKVSVSKLSDTDASLRYHLKSGKLSAEMRKECETVISWICGPLGLSVPVTITKTSASTSQPSTSQPSVAARTITTSHPLQTSQHFPSTSSSIPSFIPDHKQPPIQNNSQLFTIGLKGDITELINLIHIMDVKTPEKMKNFAQSFFDNAMKSNQNLAEFAQLARVFDDEFNNSASSFKNAVTLLVQSNFCQLLDDDAASKEQVELLVKFIGEFYKSGWIDGDFIATLMDGLAENNFETFYQLNLFCQLLRVASLTMVKNGDCGKCADYYRILKKKLKTFKKTKSHLMCLEVLEMLETMITLSDGSPEKFDTKQVREILFKMETDAAEKIKALTMKTEKDFKTFMKLLMEKATVDPDDAVTCAKLAVEIQDMSVTPETSIKDLLIDNCQTKLLYFLSNGIKLSQLSDTIGLLRFIGELYLVDVFNFDFIDMCLELIIDDLSDDAADCLKSFLSIVGEKIESENCEKHFEKIKKIAESDQSYRATIMTEIIETRNSEWRQKADLSLEEIFSQLSVDNLRSAVTAVKNKIDEFDENIFEVIQALWKLIIIGSEPEVCAKLCSEISTRQDFQEHFVNFLHRRNITFRSIKKEDFTEAIKTRLANVIAFIAELFNKGFVGDDVLESWIQLKLARQLSTTSLDTLILTITLKVNESENVRLKASMLNLEGIAHERSMEALQELKEDIEEIAGIFNEIKESKTQKKKVEAVKIEII